MHNGRKRKRRGADGKRRASCFQVPTHPWLRRGSIKLPHYISECRQEIAALTAGNMASNTHTHGENIQTERTCQEGRVPVLTPASSWTRIFAAGHRSRTPMISARVTVRRPQATDGQPRMRKLSLSRNSGICSWKCEESKNGPR